MTREIMRSNVITKDVLWFIKNMSQDRVYVHVENMS